MNHFKSNRHTLEDLRKKDNTKRDDLFLDIFSDIYDEYCKYHLKHECIDFNDMINLAISYIDSKAFSLTYKHLFVDEFQDISVTRAYFVKSILEHKNSFLTVVGDDWQSINRFAGSDISLIQNFHAFFGDSETIKLDYTFRFNNQVSNIASSFILKNPNQLHKEIQTIKVSEADKLNIFTQHVDKVKNEDGYMVYDNESFILKVLGLITDKHADSSDQISVMILDRYKYNKPDLQKLEQNQKIDLSFFTVHGSKGLEADYVILQNMISGKNGFPSKKEDDPIINLVSKSIDEYEDAEERRLFYVALTRTKHSLFISYDMYNESSFIEELANDYVDQIFSLNKHQRKQKVNCRECKTGILRKRETKSNKRDPYFYGCSNYPYCEYTERVNFCPYCKEEIERDFNIHIGTCSSISCRYMVELCLECNGSLIERSGSYGSFLGCINYPKCKYSKKIIKNDTEEVIDKSTKTYIKEFSGNYRDM